MKTKNYTLIFTIILLLGGIDEIHAQNCPRSAQQADFVTPRAKIRHLPSGDLWWDRSDGRFMIDDPRLSDNPVSAVFAGGFWAGGSDDGGNLKFAGSTYGPGTDWFPGPLDDTGQITEEDCSNYDKIWQVTKEELDLFLDDLGDNGIIDDPIPVNILQWPGRNNPHSLSENGFDLPADRGLAPFFDEDQNGTYDPTKGDYPFIKNAELAQWWIINDGGNIHGESNGQPVNIDVSVLAYSFDTDPEGNTNIFYECEITNRAVESINEFHFGLWIDVDLGCYTDDYVGCSPAHNLAYSYNQDEVDGDDNCNCPSGVSSFCNGIPLFGVKVLEGLIDENNNSIGMSNMIYYNNNGIGGPWSQGTTDPTIAIEYYNMLTGSWRDGAPLTFGADGYDLSSTDITNFAFPDPPNDPNGWSQCTANLSQSDRRIVIGSGGVRMLPGQKNKFAFAAIVTGPVDHPCPDITPLIDAADDAQTTYDGMPSSIQKPKYHTSLVLTPNPANEFVNIKLGNDELISKLLLTNANGKVLLNISQINQQQYQLLKNDLASGIYFIEVVSNKGSKGIEKIIFLD